MEFLCSSASCKGAVEYSLCAVANWDLDKSFELRYVKSSCPALSLFFSTALLDLIPTASTQHSHNWFHRRSYKNKLELGGGFEDFQVFTPTSGNDPAWLLFFRWVVQSPTSAVEGTIMHCIDGWFYDTPKWQQFIMYLCQERNSLDIV